MEEKRTKEPFDGKQTIRGVLSKARGKIRRKRRGRAVLTRQRSKSETKMKEARSQSSKQTICLSPSLGLVTGRDAEKAASKSPTKHIKLRSSGAPVMKERLGQSMIYTTRAPALGPLRHDVTAEKRQQLMTMKKRKWFSSQIIVREKIPTARQTAFTVETQLELKWKEFVESLPEVKRKGPKRIEHTQEVDEQGQDIVKALKAIPTPAHEAKWKKRAEESLEEDTKRAISRAKGYAVCPITFANPKIADTLEIFFGECAMQDPGIYIWRLEFMIPIEVEADDYPTDTDKGVLYSEDCYVILHIAGEDEAKVFTIFQWIGEKASVDKIGASAIRSRELCIYLGNKAELFREREMDESDDFLDVFGEPEYRETGGTKSGFRQIELIIPRQRMYRLTEQNGIVSMSMIPMDFREFNQQDVFVFDSGAHDVIWQWNGSRTGWATKFRGFEVTDRIHKYEKHCQGMVVRIDEGEEFKEITCPDGQKRHFWGYLRHRPRGPEKPSFELEGKPDEVHKDILLVKLVASKAGKMGLDVLRGPDKQTPLEQKMLETGNVYVLDATNEMFIWIGKLRHRKHDPRLLSPKSKKRRDVLVALQIAEKFRQRRKRPKWVRIIKVYEGFEPVSFIMKFPNWAAKLFRPLHSNYTKVNRYTGELAKTTFNKIDWEDFLSLTDNFVAPDEEDIDDGSGHVEVWAMEDGKPTFKKLGAQERGIFFTRDCYFILYTYHDVNNNMKQSYVCYFWEGRLSSKKWWPAFLFGFYPVLEKKITKHGGIAPKKIRVLEHKEPKHFTDLFDGRIVVFQGSRKTRRKNNEDIVTPKKKDFFHVRTYKNTTYAIQVPAEVNHLNSLDSFILCTNEKLYVWHGNKSKIERSDSVERIVEQIQGDFFGNKPGEPDPLPEVLTFEDGDEPKEFWNTLGGWAEFKCNREWAEKYSKKTRLYKFSNSSGRFRMDPVWRFYQTDLEDNNVYCLDTNLELFIWNGKYASESLYRYALEFAKEYIREVAKQRAVYIPLSTAVASSQKRVYKKHSKAKIEERISFTVHFHTWVKTEPFIDPMEKREESLDDTTFDFYKSEEQRKRKERIAERQKLVDKYGGLDGLKKVNHMKALKQEWPGIYEELLKRNEEEEEAFDEYSDEVMYSSSESYLTEEEESLEEWSETDELLLGDVEKVTKKEPAKEQPKENGKKEKKDVVDDDEVLSGDSGEDDGEGEDEDDDDDDDDYEEYVAKLKADRLKRKEERDKRIRELSAHLDLDLTDDDSGFSDDVDVDLSDDDDLSGEDGDLDVGLSDDESIDNSDEDDEDSYEDDSEGEGFDGGKSFISFGSIRRKRAGLPPKLS